MNEHIYQMYRSYKKISEIKVDETFDDPDREFVDDAIKNARLIDERNPEYLNRYTRESKMHKSFDFDQKGFICEQIGHWYFMMKPLLEGSHNLGHMKEELKKMICGE